MCFEYSSKRHLAFDANFFKIQRTLSKQLSKKHYTKNNVRFVQKFDAKLKIVSIVFVQGIPQSEITYRIGTFSKIMVPI